GRGLLENTGLCAQCHRFRAAAPSEPGKAPDLTGYGSREWLTAFISNPSHQRFYPGKNNDRMPPFAADPNHPDRNLLTAEEIGYLVTWLRGESDQPPAAARNEKGRK